MMREMCGVNNPWFISTPYTKYLKGWHGAYIDACKVSARISSFYDIAVFSPIAHCHGLAIHGELPPVDPKFWEDFNRPFIAACGGCIVAKLDGWENSSGIAGEIRDFRAAQKPILYCDPETLELAA